MTRTRNTPEEQPMSSQHRAALRAAIAIVTAVSVDEPTVSVQELLDAAKAAS